MELQRRVTTAGEITTAGDLVNEAARAVLSNKLEEAEFALASASALLSELLEAVKGVRVSRKTAHLALVGGLAFAFVQQHGLWAMTKFFLPGVKSVLG